MSGASAAVVAASATSAPPVTASNTPATVSGIWDSEISFGLTDSVTVTPGGGTPGYTYAWSYVSGNTGFAAQSPAAASTGFTFVGATVRAAVWRVTVTDTSGATATANVNVNAN